MADLALALSDQPSLAATTTVVLEFALETLPCDYASVCLARGRQRTRVVAARTEVREPCAFIHAVSATGPDRETTDGEGLLISETLQERRWPDWAESMSSQGINSYLRVRMNTHKVTVGALNLYSRETGYFTETQQESAQLIARQSAAALAAAIETADLCQAVEARTMIGQAQGILMERFGVDADQAFAVLMRYSQHHNVKLREVAAGVVNHRRLPDEES